MRWRLIIGVLVSAAFLFLALRGVEWGELWSTLAQTRWEYLIPTIVLSIAGHYFRALRWKYMLMPVKRVSAGSAFSATMIGLAANNVLPARLGEIVRALAIGRQEKLSRTAAFATIVYERIVDVFALLLFLWIMLLRIEGPAWLRPAGEWVLVLNLLLLVIVQLMRLFPARVIRVISRMSRPLPSSIQAAINRSTAGFIAGLAALNRPSTLVPIVLATALVWGAALYAIYYCVIAVGLQLPFLASVTLIVVVSLGSMIPSAPAYIGTFQYACVLSLSLFAVENSDALAFSLVFHASQFLPVTVLGVLYLMRSHMSFGELSKPS